GTSMSAPHITGIAALVRAAHPDWTATEVKAALMNTADADLTTGDSGTGAVYGPERAGAGRVRADLAVRTPVIAYAAGPDVPEGAVGVSYGDVPAGGPLTLTREVEVRNLGDRPVAYRTGYRAATEVAGASYTVEPAEVTVPAGGATRLRITLRVPDPAALGRGPDPTIAARQGGHPRAYRPELSGRMTLTPVGDGGVPELRVPVFAAPHAVSGLTAALAARMPLDTAGRSGLLLRIGPAEPGDSAESGDPAGPGAAVPSLVSAFELGGQSDRWPDCNPLVATVPCASTPGDRIADLRLAGAASDAPAVAARGGDPLRDGTLYLAATTWAPAATPVGRTAVRASLDTDGDGRTDAVVEADRLAGSDVLVARTLDATTGKELDVQPLDAGWGGSDPFLLDSDTVVLPVRLAALPGLRQGGAQLRYGLWTGPAGGKGVPDVQGAFDGIGLTDGRPVLPLDVLHPALDIRGGIDGPAALALPEQPGAVLEVRRDLWAFGTRSAMALLLVHHRNTPGRQAQVMPLPLW
ncbi:S8 family serine peptidase, partial [Streptacidiphilus griseoplanus]|uniref:S8 family serine peptidase n=1 Tax=Peterkaempfera griseoplana TaxID=66896 RepID=UPI000ACA4FDA